MPLSSSSVDRRIREALSTSQGKPAGVSDRNWIQTMPGKGTILRLYNRVRDPDDPRDRIPDEVVRDRALKDGVVCYLGKPLDDEDLERCLRLAVKR